MTRKRAFATGFTLLLALGFCGLKLASRPQSVKLIPMGLDTNGFHSVFLVALLTNEGPSAIEYSGYGPENPWYDYEFISSKGATNYCPFFCGTGLRRCKLASGEGVKIQIGPTDLGADYRVSIRYSNPSVVDWLRDNIPARFARLIPRPKAKTVVSSSITKEQIRAGGKLIGAASGLLILLDINEATRAELLWREFKHQVDQNDPELMRSWLELQAILIERGNHPGLAKLAFDEFCRYPIYAAAHFDWLHQKIANSEIADPEMRKRAEAMIAQSDLSK